MSYYMELLRQRVRQALARVVDRAQRARDLALVLRELASDLHLPAELRPTARDLSIDELRRHVRDALTTVLAVERDHWSRELAAILRELADEIEPPKGAGT